MLSTKPVMPGDIQQSIERAVATTLSKRPMLESLVRPFAALFHEKARLSPLLTEDLAAAACGPDEGRERLMQGVPQLADVSLSFLKTALDRAFAALVPVLRASFPATVATLDRMEAAVCDAAMDLSVLAAEYLGIRSRNLKPNRSAAIGPRLPDFVLHQVLSAVLRPWVGPLATRMRHADWQRGYCPVCGSLPSISCLSKAGELSSEFLVGGGGRRFLHCSLCGLDWPVHRNFCAVCEREETAMKCYLSVKDEAAERVDICNHCNHYLPCIDLREFEAFFHLDTAAVGMAHLDLLAQEKGFSPMVRMPWNTFQ